MSRSGLGRIGAALACSAVLSAALFFTAGAGAGIGSIPVEPLGSSHGLQYLTGFYGPVLEGDIVITGECPQGVPVSGGMHASGPSGASRVTGSFPDQGPDADPDPDEWVAQAQNIGSEPLDRFSIYPICRKAGAGGVAYEFRDLPQIPAGALGKGRAFCPAGTSVVGGGPGDIEGDLRASVPFDGPDANKKPDDGWRVTLFNDGNSPEFFSVAAVCFAPAVGKLTYASSRTLVKRARARTFRFACRPSTAVIGGGIAFARPATEGFIHEARPRDTGSDANETPDDAWVSTIVNADTARAPARAFVICFD